MILPKGWATSKTTRDGAGCGESIGGSKLTVVPWLGRGEGGQAERRWGLIPLRPDVESLTLISRAKKIRRGPRLMPRAPRRTRTRIRIRIRIRTLHLSSNCTLFH